MNFKLNYYKEIGILIWFLLITIYFTFFVSTNAKQLRKLSENNDTLYIQELLRAAKAAEIQSYLNENINPCENFYEFACSKFSKFHPPKRDGSTSILQIMSDAFKKKIEKFLNTPENINDTSIEKKMKRFYTSCINMKDVPADANKSKFMKLISDFGKMPVLSGNRDWGEEKFDWIAMIAKMQRKYGKAALLQLDVAPDFQDNNVNCLYIGQPKMLLDTKAIYNDNSTALYRDLVMTFIARQLETFLNVPKELARTTAFEIMSFEIMLSYGMWDGSVENDKMNLLTTIDDWDTKYGLVINIERFIHLTLGRVSTDCLYERVESFQANLRNLLPQVSKHVIANYLFYMLLSNDFFVRSEQMEEAQKTLCQKKVTLYFNKAFDNMIYRHYNNVTTENDIKIISEQLKLSFKHIFSSNELNWMTLKTRENAIKKLSRTNFEINSHEYDNITIEYNELIITTDYFENVKNLLLLKGKKFIQNIYKLPKTIDATELHSFLPTNLILDNKIKIPVSLLQPHFLWADVYPNSIKFGNLGTLLGHALVHGFDNEGRKFDENGMQKNWWELDSIIEFNEIKLCFIEQYKKYKFGANYLRGNDLLSENIADNAGLKLAFDAYMLWYNSSDRTVVDIERETFSQLKYTNEQLFFISFGQLWCADMNEYWKNQQTATDTHAPNMYRVIGSISNSLEFSAAFNCPKGSGMNPEIKCKIY